MLWEELFTLLWPYVEWPFRILGLDTPFKRFLFIWILGTAGEMFFQPRYAYEAPPNGTNGPWEMKPSCFFGNTGTCTYFHVGTIPFVSGLVFSGII